MSVRINDDWHSWKGWVFDKTQAPHGPMLFEMTHFTDVCNWFLADDPVEVTAVETGMLNLAVIVRYRSGALATIVIGSNGTMGYCKELYELMGNGGYLAVDHMLEVRTAGITGRTGFDHLPHDSRSSSANRDGRWRIGLARQEARRLRRGCQGQ